MTNERKAELFDRAIGWILGQLGYADELTQMEALEDVGLTDEEIAEILADDGED